MTKQQIEIAMVQCGGRVAARYRDQGGWIVQGVILAVVGEAVAIDALNNLIPFDKVLSLKHL